jgi:ribonuclease HII
LVCENFADKNYPAVSAASIIAKVDRDRKIEELKKEFNFDFGVGYSHDAKTIEFLEKLARENNGKMPKNIRTTWDTVERITEKYKQKNVLNFFKKIVKK